MESDDRTQQFKKFIEAVNELDRWTSENMCCGDLTKADPTREAGLEGLNNALRARLGMAIIEFKKTK